MANAILDFEFKGHFKGHSGKQRFWRHVVTVLQFARDETYNLPRHRLVHKTQHYTI